LFCPLNYRGAEKIISNKNCGDGGYPYHLRFLSLAVWICSVFSRIRNCRNHITKGRPIMHTIAMQQPNMVRTASSTANESRETKDHLMRHHPLAVRLDHSPRSAAVVMCLLADRRFPYLPSYRRCEQRAYNQCACDAAA
jgi:hypothetical protein